MLWLSLFYRSQSECENGCSGHGKCTMYDMCICYRNWEGNDCGDRVCQFGVAFVDAPKGDLDSSQSISGPTSLIAINSAQFPYGTSEGFPNMVDSDLRILTNTGHWYAECSGAGNCNRETGECECFDGFEGVACHRLKCPGELSACNGHGICQTVKRIADKNMKSTYKLWSKEMLTGCICDFGFHGYDCSMRSCPKGVDPLYYDDISTIQYPFFFFVVMTTSPVYDITDGHGGPGFFNLIVHDKFGQPYHTRTIFNRPSCLDLISALEEIPNGIIPRGTAKCYHRVFSQVNAIETHYINVSYKNLYKSYFSGEKIYVDVENPASQDAGYISSYKNLSTDPLMTGDLYQIQFYGNPGEFKQPILNVFSDGSRPSLKSRDGIVISGSWTSGQQGTDIDFFPSHCKGIQVKIRTVNHETYLWGSFTPTSWFKCVGTADYDSKNDFAYPGMAYDVGTIEYPHLVKLVRSVADRRDGYTLAAVYLDTNSHFDWQTGVYDPFSTPGSALRLLHPLHALDKMNADIVLFDVYSTRGVMHRIQNASQAEFDFATNKIFVANNTVKPIRGTKYAVDVSCEKIYGLEGVDHNTSALNCIDTGDFFFLLDPYNPRSNPSHMNMYKALSIRPVTVADVGAMGERHYDEPGNYDTYKIMITTDLNTNFANDAQAGGIVNIYRFVPASDDTYPIVSECSGRGNCNNFEGICECYPGYTAQACDVQHSIVS